MHLVSNISLFIDPGAHTNGVESIWNSAKIQFKTMREVSTGAALPASQGSQLQAL